MQTRVFACAECGAPLPEGASKCPACGVRVHVESGYGGEKQARASAEDLLGRLGRPPSLLERFAVGFTNPWLWLFGFIVLLRGCLYTAELPERALDALLHARVAHLWYPTGAYLLHVGVLGGGAALLLVLGIWGVRVDARRGLQAALAARPPQTPGGPLRCRECAADLTAQPGATAVRCSHCQSDNLLLLPHAWISRAKTIEKNLRWNAHEARRLEGQSRQRMKRSALWRVPLGLGILFLLMRPDFSKRATWKDFTGDVRIGLRSHQRGVKPLLAAVPRCDQPAEMKAANRVEDALVYGGVCNDDCTSSIVIPLFRGETLKTVWRSEPAAMTARLALAPRTFEESFFTPPWMGDTLEKRALGADFKIDRSAFHLLQLEGPADAAVELCIEGRAARN